MLTDSDGTRTEPDAHLLKRGSFAISSQRGHAGAKRELIEVTDRLHHEIGEALTDEAEAAYDLCTAPAMPFEGSSLGRGTLTGAVAPQEDTAATLYRPATPRPALLPPFPTPTLSTEAGFDCSLTRTSLSESYR